MVNTRHIYTAPLFDFDFTDTETYPVLPNGQRPAIYKDGYSQQVALELPPFKGVAVDMGHVLVGLDANCNQNSVGYDYLGLSVESNLATATWLGDLASALAEARIAYIYNSSWTWGKMQPVIDRFAPAVDMLGNIDGYVISARAQNKLCSNTGCFRVSDILEEYYLGSGANTVQCKRFSIFAQSIGLIWNGNSFQNEAAIVKKYGKDVALIAAFYIAAGTKKLSDKAKASLLAYSLAKYEIPNAEDLVRKFFASLANEIKKECP